MDPILPILAISAMALLYALLSQWVMENIGNPKRVKEIQNTFNSLTKEIDQAAKRKDEKRLNELVKQQEASMPLMLESMFLMYKPLIALIPLLFIFSNPHLNLDEQPLLHWPTDAAALSALPQPQIAQAMGLPAGTSLQADGPASLRLVNAGQTLGTLQFNASTMYAYYQPADLRPGFHLGTRNESGTYIVSFPRFRADNPVAVQNLFPGFSIRLPFSLPIVIQHFERFPNWRDTFGPYGWFWVSFLAFSLSISLIKAGMEKGKQSDRKA